MPKHSSSLTKLHSRTMQLVELGEASLELEGVLREEQTLSWKSSTKAFHSTKGKLPVVLQYRKKEVKKLDVLNS